MGEYLMGIGTGLLLSSFISAAFSWMEVSPLQEECERNLPRSQVCVMQYVPEEVE